MSLVERIGGATVYNGDCLEVMGLLALTGTRVDSVVCDPPYHLASIVKRFSAANAAPPKTNGATGVYKRAAAGFMGKKWDGGDISFRPETWALAFDLLKPGGHLVAFSGTRTYHRMACAIEDAGFEIRDQLGWAYGTGFPKSHKLTGKVAGFDGWGTALKPAWEPIVLARRPLICTVAENVLKYGTGAINVDACRVGSEVLPAQIAGEAKLGTFERKNMLTPERVGRFPANLLHDNSQEVQDVLGKASRFFYSAKASKADRNGSKHPTVKPVSLMKWLTRLITPPGGTILDPFAGTGTTGHAATNQGFRSILIEREVEYFADIIQRLPGERHGGGLWK